MQSPWAAMKIHQKNEMFRNQYNRAIDALKGGKSVRVTTKVAASVLLSHPTIKGSSTQVRRIGAGVVELYLKKED